MSGLYRTAPFINRKGRICSIMTEQKDGNEKFTVYTKNDDLHFDDLPEEDRRTVLTWLYYNIIPSEKRLACNTSYGMKHILQDRTDIYLSNNQFKEAMILLGHFPYDVDTLNWQFFIRKTSPMFCIQNDGKSGLPMMGYPKLGLHTPSEQASHLFGKKETGDSFPSGFSKEKAKGLQNLLADNGIDDDETATVAQAIGYLFDENWTDILDWDR